MPLEQADIDRIADGVTARMTHNGHVCLHFTASQIDGLKEWGDFVVEFKQKSKSRLISLLLSGIVMIAALGILTFIAFFGWRAGAQ